MRGRPKETEAVLVLKRTLDCYQYEFEEDRKKGWKQTWHYDVDKNKNGAYAVEITHQKPHKPDIQKGKSYGSQPVVMVFKSSNRKNAKVKMKIWNNQNVDYILTAPKLPGVPDNAIILGVGVGKSFIESFKREHNL